MSAVLIFSSIAVAAPVISAFIFTGNNERRKEKLFLELSRQGTLCNLIFCSQELLANGVLGFDGLRRQLMVIEMFDKRTNCSVIQLDEVQNCEMVLTTAGSDRTYFIELLFEFKNGARPTSLKFYEGLAGSGREFLLMRAKAEYWRTLFLKMVTTEVKLCA